MHSPPFDDDFVAIADPCRVPLGDLVVAWLRLPRNERTMPGRERSARPRGEFPGCDIAWSMLRSPSPSPSTTEPGIHPEAAAGGSTDEGGR